MSNNSGRNTAVDESGEGLPRYVVGIDLGTTNCAVAYVDSWESPWQVRILDVPQWVDWGSIERRSTLPSFLYQLTEDGQEACSDGLPWESGKATHVVGVLARDAGMRQPGRRISSAKSWLSHDGVDRSADLLPWHGDSDVERMSPVAASSRYLQHIRDAWNDAFSEYPLATQDVVITLPASFDEVARELTVAAAKQAGLPRIYLIEEPQSAFYAWIDSHRGQWEEIAKPGQTILVCDIGGGTSDFTLIRVRAAGAAGTSDTGPESASGSEVRGAKVQFHRVAVGNHLILGGDNLDLALAKLAEAKLQSQGPLSGRDWDRLIQVCRVAKEELLHDNRPASRTVTLAGEGTRLIGGARSVEVTADDVDTCLVEGFFPRVCFDEHPHAGESGFREFGLPYASDPAITKHLAEFLATHGEAGLTEQEIQFARNAHQRPGKPDFVLFNGGVMNAVRLRNRIVEVISDWYASSGDSSVRWEPEVLEATRLDLAVAHGAAYFGMVRRGEGVRIAANLGRSYYMQVSDQPPEMMCLIPGSAEAGQTFLPEHVLKLELGTPVQFPLWVSSTRLADTAGHLVDLDRSVMTPLPPIRTVLSRGRERQQRTIQVRIETELSEIGTLGLFLVETEGGKRWRLEFDIRATLETDRQAHVGAGEAGGVVDSETLEKCEAAISGAFNALSLAPGKLMGRLREATELDRGQWPPSLLREMWSYLMEHSTGRRKSAAHEARWLNLVGYCLRPGYGMAVDDWRVSEVWRMVHGKLAFAAPSSRTESLILWRRIAGGLTRGQQTQLFSPAFSALSGKAGKIEPHEAAELWRLAGSLEWISPREKQELAELATEELGRKRAAGYRDALWWTLGRLGNRHPLYGPLNTVIPGTAAERLLATLAGPLVSQEPSEQSARQLAVMMLAQKTGDRYLDISSGGREDAIDWLRRTDAPANFLEQVSSGEGLTRQDESAMFGESLPLGIRLIR